MVLHWKTSSIISKYLDEQVEQQKQLEFQNSVDVKSNLQGLDLLDLPDDQTDI